MESSEKKFSMKSRKKDSVSRNPVQPNALALKTFYQRLIKQKSSSKKKPIVSYPISQTDSSKHPVDYPTQRVLKLLHKTKGINKNYVHNDPIGKHILALRKCSHDLSKQFLKVKRKPGLSHSMVQIKIPEYPVHHPMYCISKGMCKDRHTYKPQLSFKSHFSKEKIDQLRDLAIEKIVMQVGYHVDDKLGNSTEALNVLSYVAGAFLQSFIDRMRFHKDSALFRKSLDLYSPLESTLCDFGFGGIQGVGKYFYEDFCRLEESLYDDCKKQLHNIAIQAEKPSKRKYTRRKNTTAKVNDNSNATLVKDDDNNAAMVQNNDCNANSD